MFPIDGEFLILYFFYLFIGVVLLYGSCFSKMYKTFFKGNLLVFALYSGLFIYVFLDETNFHGGGSLVVLFYCGLILLLHILVLLIFGIYKSILTNYK